MTDVRIGNYVIEHEIGSGGMGSVYLGRSRSGRAVAIKVIKAEYAADPQFRARFRKEVEAARRVGGFHTAAVVDADPDAPRPWMASAFVKGPTLAEEVAHRGPLAEARLWMLAAALAEALEAIHMCGLVHRDLKPGNIVLAEDGPRVLDFGIAQALEGTRITSDGAALGTPGFLAPEQARGLPVTGACDVFALGAVLIAAAGGSAFGYGQPYGLLYRAVHEAADVSALPEALRPLVLTCLRKDPERRPTPRQLLDLCTDRGDPEPATVSHSPSAPYSAPGPRTRSQLALYRRSRRSWTFLVLRNVLVTLGLGAVVMFHLSLRVPANAMLFFVIGFIVMALRLLGLIGSVSDGVVFSDLGIGVGSPRNLAVLRWSEIASLELEADVGETYLVVRLTADGRLPMRFQKPMWIRTTRDGATRIRTAWLRPIGDTTPLPDTARAFAARHNTVLTES